MEFDVTIKKVQDVIAKKGGLSPEGLVLAIEKLFLSSARSCQTAKGPRGNNSDWPNWCAVSAHVHLCGRYDECNSY